MVSRLEVSAPESDFRIPGLYRPNTVCGGFFRRDELEVATGEALLLRRRS